MVEINIHCWSFFNARPNYAKHMLNSNSKLIPVTPPIVNVKVSKITPLRDSVITPNKEWNNK